MNSKRDEAAKEYSVNDAWVQTEPGYDRDRRHFCAGWDAGEIAEAEAHKATASVLQVEIERLREALAFYADKKNWGEHGDMREWYRIESTDRGAKARAALAVTDAERKDT